MSKLKPEIVWHHETEQGTDLLLLRLSIDQVIGLHLIPGPTFESLWTPSVKNEKCVNVVAYDVKSFFQIISSDLESRAVSLDDPGVSMKIQKSNAEE
jgi:hypothetical protein